MLWKQTSADLKHLFIQTQICQSENVYKIMQNTLLCVTGY
jgi:hypothetical protein